MLLTLLLDPHWNGLGEDLAFGLLCPFVLAGLLWLFLRGLPLVRSANEVDKRDGWMCWLLGIVVAIAFYMFTLGSVHSIH